MVRGEDVAPDVPPPGADEGYVRPPTAKASSDAPEGGTGEADTAAVASSFLHIQLRDAAPGFADLTGWRCQLFVSTRSGVKVCQRRARIWA